MQVALAFGVLAIMVSALVFVRGGLQPEEEVATSPSFQSRAPLPPKVPEGPAVASATAGAGYGGVVVTRDFVPGLPNEQIEIPEWDEQVCKDFTTHLRELEGTKPDPEIVAGMNSWCEDKAVPTRFMRCALGKKSADKLIECADKNLKTKPRSPYYKP